MPVRNEVSGWRNWGRLGASTALIIGGLFAREWTDDRDDSDKQSYPVGIVAQVDCWHIDSKQPITTIEKKSSSFSDVKSEMAVWRGSVAAHYIGGAAIASEGCVEGIGSMNIIQGDIVDFTVTVEKTDGLPPPAVYDLRISEYTVHNSAAADPHKNIAAKIPLAPISSD
jgi:hypothetical protein